MRKLVYFTVGFCASCAVCAYLYPPALLTIGVILLILAALLFVLHKLQVKVRRLSAVILGAAMAFLWFFFYDHMILNPVRASDGKVLPFEITATDFGYETDYGTAFEGVITHNGRTYRVQTYLDETQAIEPGTVVSGPFYLRFTANGGDREPTSHRGSGMFLILYQEAQVQISHNEDVPFYCYPAIWRRMLRDTLTAAFPADAAMMEYAISAAEMVNPGHVKIGRVATGDQFICDKAVKNTIIVKIFICHFLFLFIFTLLYYLYPYS